jgi:hypothetical protein
MRANCTTPISCYKIGIETGAVESGLFNISQKIECLLMRKLVKW